MKIILGSGSQRFADWVTVDKMPEVLPDVVHDLSHYPWPFESDSVEEALCSHVIEHVVEQGREEQFFAFFRELWRICRNTATVMIVVPDAASDGAYSDPGHKSFYNKNIFTFVSKKCMFDNKNRHTHMTEYQTDFDFDIIQLNIINGDIHCRLQAVK